MRRSSRYVLPAALIASLLGGEAGAQSGASQASKPPTAPPQMGKPQAAKPPSSAAQPNPPASLKDAAVAALDRCLAGDRWTLGPGYTAIAPDQASGLPGGMRVARQASPSGRLVVYEDNGEGSLIECGVAIYGAAPADMAGAFQQAIARDKPRYLPASPDAWKPGGADPTVSHYWADPGAPGLYGVLMRQFNDPASPTIQVDSHAVLVR